MIRTKFPSGKEDRIKPKKIPGLTPRREQFIKEYLIDFNVTRAAAAAGYKVDGKAGIGNAQTAGAQALRHPTIQSILKKEIDKRAQRIEITQDMVIRELAKIAFADLGTYLTWGQDGVYIVNSSNLPDTSCVSEVSQAGPYVKIKLHDKRSALELLGKHLGMFTNKVELSGKLEEQVINKYEILHKIEEYADVYSKLAHRGRSVLQSGDESDNTGEPVD